MALKLPALGTDTVTEDSGSERTLIVPPSQSVPAPATAPAALPLIGGRPTQEQFKILAAAVAISVLLALVMLMLTARSNSHSASYISAAGQMRMLSQRIAKSAQVSLLGNQAALTELSTSRTKFSELLQAVSQGGPVDERSVPASPAGVAPQLDALTAEWEKTDRNVSMVLSQEKNLVALGNAVSAINSKNPQLLELAEQVAALKLQVGANAREIATANQVVMLTQRIAKNANQLLVGDAIAPEVAFLLGKDSTNFRQLINGLTNGSEALRIGAANDPDTKERLGRLDKAAQENEQAISSILSSVQPLVQAKQAGSAIVRDSGALFDAADKLDQAYDARFGGISLTTLLAVVFGMLALGAVFLMARLYNNDIQRRRQEAEEQMARSEEERSGAQQAILRLMNEMGDLADGDLTVRTTVTEDITGAIADSVNYTIEELRVLVRRINDAAQRVSAATTSAQRTSSELLAATERQSQEITEAGDAVLSMARSISEVSNNANQSAQVARQSLEAAEKGALAVSNSIRGMNDIRDQIQETSKRIKRLGESSQEIGEIVELISDITEQTNVLALNAAIQAASAGEAGRGFTVVAEEVQRLAERSAEATKQIAAIVKTIQTDTQDAVSAMENSTRGVVDGAKLSDNAGQALAEISEVSQRLASLIEQITLQTQQQAGKATQVAQTMKSILRVTEQTTQGTQETAVSIGQLAELAVELKGSVSGFKV
ncbi:MAG TPA: methyl-accepting chemotaxis protein [Rhodocyclaceae bacterium]|nr:methyl-accepting chemotaxis protein [Rhodocyclaceae bacterium]HMZ83103.1 methyl-accepting chemotaxis protein [Rhodocyclaceae bacterium]HNA02664.1 methyl-accepting chemotaxis protein [Rhodocyclaceae bacterium]HNB77749.1 methyl-accepting chemotaxis protein [Rhodocyclaceae bacterium]HNC60442.1 methyl-accepting chemotaxis protein [Rhodocyclaceae bacterium]